MRTVKAVIKNKIGATFYCERCASPVTVPEALIIKRIFEKIKCDNCNREYVIESKLSEINIYS